MKRFVEGEDRFQSTLFPEMLDDYVSEDNAVRVIDVFIDELDLRALGFRSVDPSVTGRPAYHPASLLKIYVYGYLNRVQSSRRLEHETQRNVEMMWLTGRLMPDHKTIADFRKNNGPAIKNVCKEFVQLCRRLNLFSEALVAIDGSKFRAVNNYDKNFSRTKVKRRLEQLEESIDRYLGELESVDRVESSIAETKKECLKDKIKTVRKEVRRIKKIGAQVLESPDNQVSLTDPDARSMRTRSKSSGTVGYNVQTAVDARNHLIIAHEVTNTGSDRSQLYNMAVQAREAMGAKALTVLADRGYYKGEEILACHEASIVPYVPKSHTSGNQAKGLFGKRDFQYITQDDEYRCPAGERLSWRTTSHEKGQILYRYWSSTCQTCPIKSQCTTGKERRVTRWEHEEVLDVMQARLDKAPDIMRIRRSTVEHPFGTLKAWMGATHFTMKTKKRVSTEMSLHVLAYNLKRVMNILGVRPLVQAIQA
ncbi:MAG: IS1182 family transposase [Gammaproteobacteria bacterium]|nr:IS1182 family transposase [Gammaproteobacteria bacterium]